MQRVEGLGGAVPSITDCTCNMLQKYMKKNDVLKKFSVMSLQLFCKKLIMQESCSCLGGIFISLSASWWRLSHSSNHIDNYSILNVTLQPIAHLITFLMSCSWNVTFFYFPSGVHMQSLLAVMGHHEDVITKLAAILAVQANLFHLTSCSHYPLKPWSQGDVTATSLLQTCRSDDFLSSSSSIHHQLSVDGWFDASGVF